MKTFWIVTIIIFAFLMPIAGVLIGILIFDWSFLPLWILLITEGILGLIAGFVFLIMKARSRIKIPEIIKPVDLEEKVIQIIRDDISNPDNFFIKAKKTFHIGERGTENTEIKTFLGTGTETDTIRIVIINMKAPESKISHLIDPPKQEIDEAIRLIADNPPDKVVEEMTSSLDQFGRQIIKTTRISASEAKEKKEKQEEEEKISMGGVKI